jgi:hypothetical protein
MSKLDLFNQSAPSTPSTGRTSIYVDSADKHLKIKDDAGLVTDLAAASGAITALTGEVTASGGGSAAATVTNSAVLGKVLTGLSATSGDLVASDTILQAMNKLAGRSNAGWFGNGAVDGSLTYTINTTLVRDVYATTIVINAGVTVNTAGFRMFATSSITGVNATTSIIDRSGNDASAGTVGAALAAGTTGASGIGGAAGTTLAGGAGGASATGIGLIGGAGGTGSGGAGGAAGAVTVPTTANGGVECLSNARQAQVARDLANTLMNAGSGGGGGGGEAGAGTSGAGGSGGGIITLSARVISNIKISAHGGNGSGATAVTVGRGGGGGGGGGCVILISENDTTADAVTVDVAGGLGGAGLGTGTNGSNGSTGRIVRVRV